VAALATFAAGGDRMRQGWALNDLGLVDLERGALEAAALRLEQALAIKRERGLDLDTAITLLNLGEVARRRGDTARAEDLYHESLALARQNPGLPGPRPDITATLLVNLGHLRRDGDDAAAAALFREGLAIEQRLGHAFGLAVATAGIAGLALDRGRPRTAVRLFASSQATLDRLGSRLQEADHLVLEADLRRARALLDPAAWAAARSEGHDLPSAEAIELAMDDAAWLD
jgi:tetratricopeptide (TPR) repeat protein